MSGVAKDTNLYDHSASDLAGNPDLSRLDDNLNALVTKAYEIIDCLDLILRADGEIVDGKVRIASLHAEVKAAIAAADAEVDAVLSAIVTAGEQTAAGVVAGHTGAGGTALTHSDTFTGGIGATAYTIGDLVAILKTAGMIAD